MTSIPAPPWPELIDADTVRGEAVDVREQVCVLTGSAGHVEYPLHAEAGRVAVKCDAEQDEESSG